MSDGVKVGDQVFWYHGGITNNQPCVAWVMQDSPADNVLMLTVLADHGPVVFDGVQPHGSPMLSNPRIRKNGCWSKDRLDRMGS